jgi:hypothetical protein
VFTLFPYTTLFRLYGNRDESRVDGGRLLPPAAGTSETTVYSVWGAPLWSAIPVH